MYIYSQCLTFPPFIFYSDRVIALVSGVKCDFLNSGFRVDFVFLAPFFFMETHHSETWNQSHWALMSHGNFSSRDFKVRFFFFFVCFVLKGFSDSALSLVTSNHQQTQCGHKFVFFLPGNNNTLTASKDSHQDIDTPSPCSQIWKPKPKATVGSI